MSRPPGQHERRRSDLGQPPGGEEGVDPTPARRSAHRAKDKHPLKLAQRNRLVPGPVSQRAIRDLAALREAPRAAPEQDASGNSASSRSMSTSVLAC